MCDTLRKVNPHKADGIPGRVLRACAEQLAEVFTNIFYLSLAQATVPNCFKTATILPVTKHAGALALNDFRPVALTPIIAKCFERQLRMPSPQLPTLPLHTWTEPTPMSGCYSIFQFCLQYSDQNSLLGSVTRPLHSHSKH